MTRIYADYTSCVFATEAQRTQRFFSFQFSVVFVALWLSSLCLFNMFYLRKSVSSAFYSLYLDCIW